MRRFHRRLVQLPLAGALALASLAGIVSPSCAWAQTPPWLQPVPFDFPELPAEEALKRFIAQTDYQLLYSAEMMADVRTNAVAGVFAPWVMLVKMFEGTRVEVVAIGPGAVTLQRRPVELLNPILVTARLQEERMLDVPIAMDVTGNKAMTRHGATSVVDVLGQSPGVSAYDYGLGITNVSIRGIATTLGGNANGYYLNELPFTGVTVPLAPDVRAWDLDRVEVLRGPQGTLFGEGSMGGTVRIFTNRPQMGRFGFSGQLSGSATAGGGPSTGSKVMLNVPVGDSLALRVAATSEQLVGWVDEVQPARRNINSSKIDTTRLAVRVDPTERFRIDASYWTYAANIKGDNEAADGQRAPLNRLAGGTRSELTGISATYELDRVSLLYAFSTNDFTLPMSGPFYGGVLDASVRLKIRTHEMRWGSSSSERLKWTVGLYRREALRNDAVIFEVRDIDSRSSAQLTGSAMFGEVSYRPESVPVELTFGLRKFRDRLKSQDANFRALLPPVKGTFKALNPRYGLAWFVSPGWQIYASATRGFRSGQGQAGASVVLAKSMGVDLPSTLAPDSIWSYELGSKAVLLDRCLVLEGAIYRSDWKDFAVRVPLGSTGLNGLLSSPGTRTHGVETSAKYFAAPNLSLNVHGSYVRGRYAGAVAGTSIVKGTRTDEVPPITWGGSVDYLLGSIAGWSSHLSSSYLHSAKRMSFTTRNSKPGDTINALNLHLAFEKGPWAVSLFADNLTNDGGAVSARTLEVESETKQRYTAYRLRPRSIGIEVRYSLGK